MLIQIDQPGVNLARGPVFLAAGFRPFFLLAGLQAALMLPLWLAQLFGGLSLSLGYAPVLWHGHEMLFGFGTAAVGGFLLTAVPNWTGAAGVKGAPLGLLVAIWLAARIAMALGGLLPPWVALIPSLAFLPLLGAFLALPLIKAGKVRNIMFLGLLLVLTIADALVQVEMNGWAQTGQAGLYLGLFLLLMMIGVVGGRIIPGFTQSGMRMAGVTVTPVQRPRLDKAALLSLAACGLSWVFLPGSPLAGALSLLAAVLHLVRLSGWKGWVTGPVPLLWVLHIGYLWLCVGLLLLGISAFGGLLTSTALHALTLGTIGTMVVGVMSRAALGHSGRPLVPAKTTVAAYVLIQLAALARVFGVMLDADKGLWLSGLLWTAAFAAFVWVYAPVCLLPRSDGKAG